MTLERWRDVAIIIYAVWWTVAGVIFTVLAVQLYKRASAYLDGAREAGEFVTTVAGISAIVRQLVMAFRGGGKDKEEDEEA